MKYKPTLTRKDFFDLDIYEQRVAIAKDVLLRLDCNLILPRKGLFVHSKSFVNGRHGVSQTTVNTNVCSVCAKGAIVCSWFGNLNKHGLDTFSLDDNADFDDKNSGHWEVVRTFGDTWKFLERLFEGWNYSSDDIRVRNYIKSLIDIPTETRLRVIFKNLVKNKGKILVPGINKKAGIRIG